MMDPHYEQFGWQSGFPFLWGRNLYAPGTVSQANIPAELYARARHLVAAPGGSLARWSRAANSLFAQGCEPQSLALLCSFAAPLIRIYNGGDSGAIVSLVSNRPNSGKTTALEAAASVWGQQDGVRIGDDDTKPSHGLKLRALGNLPVLYDSLHSRDPEVIRSFVTMFTDGRGQVGTKDVTWQTIMVLAAATPVADILHGMAGGDDTAGRVLEFRIDVPKSLRKGDELRKELKANCGWAADAYLRRLVQPETLAWLNQGLPKWAQEIQDYTGLAQSHRFWVSTLACVAAAGQMVHGMGMLEFSPSRIVSWAMDEMKVMGKSGVIPAARGPVEMIRQFMDEHVREILVVPRKWTSASPMMVPMRALDGTPIGRHEVENGTIYIWETHLRTWVKQRGIDTRDFFAALHKAGVLVRQNKRVTLGAGTEYSGPQVPAYEINAHHPAFGGMLEKV